jgi:hypothetical protein
MRDGGGLQRKYVTKQVGFGHFRVSLPCHVCLLWRPALEDFLGLFLSMISTLQKRDVQKPDLVLVGYPRLNP